MVLGYLQNHRKDQSHVLDPVAIYSNKIYSFSYLKPLWNWNVIILIYEFCGDLMLRRCINSCFLTQELTIEVYGDHLAIICVAVLFTVEVF